MVSYLVGVATCLVGWVHSVLFSQLLKRYKFSTGQVDNKISFLK